MLLAVHSQALKQQEIATLATDLQAGDPRYRRSSYAKLRGENHHDRYCNSE